jgi:urea transporter
MKNFRAILSLPFVVIAWVLVALAYYVSGESIRIYFEKKDIRE